MLTSIAARCRCLAAGALLAASCHPAAAQLLPAAAPAQAYSFLTLTLVTSLTKDRAKLLVAPAFNGQTAIQLEPVNAFLPAKRLEQLRRNDEILTQNLGELSAAGWELIQIAPTTPPDVDKDLTLTRYLFRKPVPRP